MKLFEFNTNRNILNNQYNEIKWLDSGLEKDELQDKVLEMTYKQKDASIPMVKAKTFEFILENAQIAIDREDVFQDKINAVGIMTKQRYMWFGEVYEKYFSDDLIYKNHAYDLGAFTAEAVMFDYFGIINGFLMKLGIVETNINWFENRGTAMAIVILCSLWNTFGMNVLYFSAAVANVPEELYESARLEGAGAVTMFFKITLPMIAPVLQTVLLLSIVGSLQTNDLILVLTNGAPAGGTFTVNSYLTHNFAPGFFTGEIMPNIGYGSSLSLISAVILGFIAFGYSKLSARLQNIY